MTDKIYTAALVIIGDEILSGRTHDKNTPWIAEQLTALGIRLGEVRVIPDKEQTIIDTVNVMRAAHDYVFTTGGIGPTHDDITAESVAHAFGVEVELHDGAYQELLKYYKDENEITEARKKMAMIPQGGELTRIMQSMFDAVAPTLKGGKPVQSRSVTADLPESAVADELGIIQKKYPEISIGSYPQYRNGKFGTTLVMRGINDNDLDAATEDVVALVKSLGDENPEIS